MNVMKLVPLVAACGLLGAGSAHAGLSLGDIGGFGVELEGLLQTDGYWFDNDVADLDGSASTDTEFGARRAEVVLKGKRDDWDWSVAYDFEGEKFLDSFLRRRVGAHALRLGQYKQHNSYEELSSSKHNDFIAKSLSTNLFAVGRRLGAEYAYDQSNWGLSAGVFGRELTRNRAENAGWGARGYWLPILQDGSFLHLGVSYVDADTTEDTARFSARPGADLAAVKLLDTG